MHSAAAQDGYRQPVQPGSLPWSPLASMRPRCCLQAAQEAGFNVLYGDGSRIKVR